MLIVLLQDVSLTNSIHLKSRESRKKWNSGADSGMHKTSVSNSKPANTGTTSETEKQCIR